MLKDIPSIQHCANGMFLNYFWSGENLGIQDFVCAPSLYFEGELSWPATSRTLSHSSLLLLFSRLFVDQYLQVGFDGHGHGMIRAQRVQIDSQGSSEQRLRPLVVALVLE